MLQNLYALSDKGTVAVVIDSRAFSDFCEADTNNRGLNSDTLGWFRNLLIQQGLQERLFTQVVKMLMERGLILKKGTIVDSTIALSFYILFDFLPQVYHADLTRSPIDGQGCRSVIR